MKLFVCIQATLKPECLGEKTIIKSCITNTSILEDTYDLNTVRKNVVEMQFNKIQQEDYDFVITTLTQIH